MKLRQFPAAKKSIPEWRYSIKVGLNLPETLDLVNEFYQKGFTYSPSLEMHN
jgi:hypothetical protein